ncbi:MAG TPA: hypothetical protein VFG13_06630 [Blastococcus sp.]|nr:hypothetical protein [Blastococcus sp.]
MSTAGSSTGSDAGTGSGEKHAAGAFDVRNVIAALIGFYGVVLVVVGLVDNSDEALEKAGGFNANLWVGLGMLVFALAFALWSRLRPIVVAVPKTRGDEGSGAS